MENHIKKTLLLSVTIVSLITLVACGNKKSNDSSTKVSTSSSGSVAMNERGFKNGVLTMRDFKVKITSTKVIPAGNEANMNDKPVLAIYYEMTNTSGRDDIKPGIFSYYIKAIQDNNSQSVNELEYSIPMVGPDGNRTGKYSDAEYETIKKRGTVAGVIGYELTDTKTPVKLTFEDFGDKLPGSYTINLD